MFVMHGGLLLRYYRPYSRDWCMRGWLILGRICICVCELHGRQLHSCVLVIIVHELRGGRFPRNIRLDCMHGVHCGVLLCFDWSHCSDRGVRCR